MKIKLLSLATCVVALGCADHHRQPGDAAVNDGAFTDAPSDASPTVCDYLITEAQPCSDDCLRIDGLVLHPAATCLDVVTPRDYVWCATRGRISSFNRDCYVLPDGTRLDIQWIPFNEPSNEYCSSLPFCPAP